MSEFICFLLVTRQLRWLQTADSSQVKVWDRTPTLFSRKAKSFPDTVSRIWIHSHWPQWCHSAVLLSLTMLSNFVFPFLSFFCFVLKFGCHFWFLTVHNRNDTYSKRSDTEAALGTQDLSKFLETFWRTLDFSRVSIWNLSPCYLDLKDQRHLIQQQNYDCCSVGDWEEKGNSTSGIKRWLFLRIRD